MEPISQREGFRDGLRVIGSEVAFDWEIDHAHDEQPKRFVYLPFPNETWHLPIRLNYASFTG